MFHGQGSHLQTHMYEKNQYYMPHQDYFSDSFNVKDGGQRVSTMLMYLTNLIRRYLKDDDVHQEEDGLVLDLNSLMVEG
ncbi:hypothetical protein Dimus_013730 [Dionaea muscipula]